MRFRRILLPELHLNTPVEGRSSPCSPSLGSAIEIHLCSWTDFREPGQKLGYSTDIYPFYASGGDVPVALIGVCP